MKLVWDYDTGHYKINGTKHKVSVTSPRSRNSPNRSLIQSVCCSHVQLVITEHQPITPVTCNLHSVHSQSCFYCTSLLYRELVFHSVVRWSDKHRLHFSKMWAELDCIYPSAASHWSCEGHLFLQRFLFDYTLFCSACNLFAIENLCDENSLVANLTSDYSQTFPRPVLQATLFLSLMHLSPLLSINTPHTLPFKKPDSHWFSDLYAHQHHPIPSSGSVHLLQMVPHCLHHMNSGFELILHYLRSTFSALFTWKQRG